MPLLHQFITRSKQSAYGVYNHTQTILNLIDVAKIFHGVLHVYSQVLELLVAGGRAELCRDGRVA